MPFSPLVSSSSQCKWVFCSHGDKRAGFPSAASLFRPDLQFLSETGRTATTHLNQQRVAPTLRPQQACRLSFLPRGPFWLGCSCLTIALLSRATEVWSLRQGKGTGAGAGKNRACLGGRHRGKRSRHPPKHLAPLENRDDNPPPSNLLLKGRIMQLACKKKM